MLRDTITRFFSSLPPLSALAVAVSGGSDSVALLCLLKEYATEQRITLTALTVDHGLRKEAAAEAAQVAAWCKALHVPHHILRGTGESLHNNTQTHARNLRYGLMLEWCIAHNVPVLALAHHQDDQAETVLMRLVRGSGVDGLSAMRPLRTERGVQLLRPLLAHSKADLREYLRSIGQVWLEDPSNQNMDYTRNRLRQALEQALPEEDRHALTQRLGALAEHCARASAALDFATQQFLQLHYQDGTLPRPALLALPEDLALRALLWVLQQVSGAQDTRPRMEELQRLYTALQDPIGKRTLHGCVIKWSDECLVMSALST